MKIARYETGGQPRLAVLHGNLLYDCAQLFMEAGENPPEVVLNADIKTICAAPEPITVFLAEYLQNTRHAADPDGRLTFAVDQVRLLAPIPNPNKIICIGLNYQDHCDEQNKPRPPWPMLFAKFANTVTGPHDRVRVPANTQELDFEAELGVIIGRGGRDIPRTEAMSHVFGYTVVHDVSARDLQKSDGQWVRAKSQDGFAPMGPCVILAQAIPDPQKLAVRSWHNGRLMQDGNTSNMIFPIDELIEFITQSLTLDPGDIISTGTPAGVGVHRTPQVLINDGDVIEIEIPEIGRLRNTFYK